MSLQGGTIRKNEKVSSLTVAGKQEKPSPPRDISMYQVKFVTYKLKRKQVGRRFKSGYT